VILKFSLEGSKKGVGYVSGSLSVPVVLSWYGAYQQLLLGKPVSL